jgi:DNA-directed RNA polymerase subunit M/transcription elongation factor TFIIS
MQQNKNRSIKKEEIVECPACQQRLSLEWFFRAHILDNGNTVTCMDINSNPFARKPPVATKAAALKAVNQAKSASRSVKKKKSKSRSRSAKDKKKRSKSDDPVDQPNSTKRQKCQPVPILLELPDSTMMNAPEDGTAAVLPTILGDMIDNIAEV